MVKPKKRARLDMAVSAIQQRWGVKALRQASPSPDKGSTPCIPTGFAELDRLLEGGVPRGRISELLGWPTAGMGTLACKVIAMAQSQGDLAAYVDLANSFDPDYAARCGVVLADLALVRPQTGLEALQVTLELVQSNSVGILVFDAVTDLLASELPTHHWGEFLRRVTGRLGDSPTALLFLTPLFVDQHNAQPYPSGLELAHYATLRLWMEKRRWLRARQDIRGYEATVTVHKNKLGPDQRATRIRIDFDHVVQGNGT